MLSALSPGKYLAILIAAIAGFAFGAVWYGLLGRQWMAARGLSEAEAKARTGPSPVPFIVSFIALLIMALMLSGVLVHLARGGTEMSLRSGMISGFFLWLGFVITAMAVNHAFQGERRLLTVIDGGHWLGVLLIQGAILGWWGLG
ncbi:MAG: DUF1761 domain-containing protein [Hyphomicrobiaceae bacterium]